MGKSNEDSSKMRVIVASLLASVLISASIADERAMTKLKIKFGRRQCSCQYDINENNCKASKFSCDKKCNGVAKNLKIKSYTFNLSAKKGKATVSQCTAPEPTTTEAPSGSGASGSGPTGSGGSGSEPLTGSGSGSGPMPPSGGEGLQCSCKCDCPDGSGECDCDCNCPMMSKALTCAAGFTKVCPKTEDSCPEDMDEVCPVFDMPMPAGRMMGGNAYGKDKGCQCVPDFLMSLMKAGMELLGQSGMTGRSLLDAENRAMTKLKIKFGKRQCSCQYDINKNNCKASKFSCDKKCNGAAKNLKIGSYTFNLSA